LNGRHWETATVATGLAAGPPYIIVLKQPFATRGKLKPKLIEPRLIIGSTNMPLDKSVPHIRRLRHLVNN